MENKAPISSDGHKALLMIMGPIVLILVLMIILVFSTRGKNDEIKNSTGHHSNL